MTTISREYAEALFELAVQAGVTKETSEGLETVVSALLQTPEYRALLASPAISKDERIAALNDAFRGKIPEVLRAILRMMALKESEMVALRAKLEKKLGRTVTLQCRVSPELIGGVRVEVDGRVIDGSIRNKLDEIKEVMNA